MGCFPGGTKLLAGTLCELGEGQRVESFYCSPQRGPRLCHSSLPAKPPSVPEEHPTPVAGPGDQIAPERLPVQSLCTLVSSDHRSGVSDRGSQKRTRRVHRQRLQLFEICASLRTPPAGGRSLNEIRESPSADKRMVSRVGGIERSSQVLEALLVELVRHCAASANELHKGKHRSRANGQKLCFGFACHCFGHAKVAPLGKDCRHC